MAELYKCHSDTSFRTWYYVYDVTKTRSGDDVTLTFDIGIEQSGLSAIGDSCSRDMNVYINNVLAKTFHIKKKADTGWGYDADHYPIVDRDTNKRPVLTYKDTTAAAHNIACRIDIVRGSDDTSDFDYTKWGRAWGIQKVPSLLWTIPSPKVYSWNKGWNSGAWETKEFYMEKRYGEHGTANFNIAIPVKPNSNPTAPTAFALDAGPYIPGQTKALTWSGATDPNSNIAGYHIERQIGTNAFTAFATTGIVNTVNVTIPDNRGSRLKYAIKTVDAGGLASGWVYTLDTNYIKQLPVKPLINSLSPIEIIPGANSYININITPSTLGYTTIKRFEAIMKNTITGLYYNNKEVMGSCLGTLKNIKVPIVENPLVWKEDDTWTFEVRAVDDYDEVSSYATTPNFITIKEGEILIGGKATESYDIIRTTKIMSQLKQLDLYRAEEKSDNDDNAWDFRNGEALEWAVTYETGSSIVNPPIPNKLYTNLSITKPELNIDTDTTPYLSFQYDYTLGQPINITKLYPSAQIVSIESALTAHGISGYINGDSYVWINSYPFLRKTNSTNTIMYLEFYQKLVEYINFLQENSSYVFNITITYSDDSTYLISDIPLTEEKYFAATLPSNKTIKAIIINVLYSDDTILPIQYRRKTQVGFTYVKFDSMNVFELPAIRGEVVTIEEENNMRTLVQATLPQTDEIWSDEQDLAIAGDVIQPTYLTNQ